MPKMEAKKQRRDPKPEILRIEELVGQVKTGDIKLPKFQRPFVWKKKDILSLLDSIYKGYPIGSILLWLTEEKLASEKNIADLSINERDGAYPTNYILDGQQRLSTLCGALYWDGGDAKSQWNIAFDLERERFIYPENEERIEYLPLNKLLNTLDFLSQIQKLSASARKERYAENATKLLASIRDYRVACVTLKDMNLNEVAPIFERINSTGRKLTIVDLMRAAIWKGGFDLNDAVRSVKNACKQKNFEGITELHVLRSISAAIGHSFNTESIEKLRDHTSEQLTEASTQIVSAYKLSVDFLTRELPLSSLNYLPYALQLNFLVEFFRVCPNPSFHQRNELKRWFWSTSFARYFASLNTNLINRDIEEFRAFARNEIVELRSDYNIKHYDFLKESFALNKASSQSFALLLAQKRPKSLLDGASINIERALSSVNRHEFHHIFPKAYLKSKNTANNDINQHANICLLSSYNNKQISDEDPGIYFADISNRLGVNMQSVLSSNFINEEAMAFALAQNFESFIAVRTELIVQEIKALTRKSI